jgi:hypothetical protein
MKRLRIWCLQEPAGSHPAKETFGTKNGAVQSANKWPWTCRGRSGNVTSALLPPGRRYERGIALCAALLLMACEASYTHVAAPYVARVATPTAVLDPHVAAAAMARLRGTTYDVPMSVHELEGPAFIERRFAGERLAPSASAPEGFWSSFHFAADAPSAITAARSALQDVLLGFYDFKTDELFIRRGPGSSDLQRFVLAHEVPHRLGVALRQGQSFDETFAQTALIEGDANVMAAAYLALEAHRSVGVAIARVRDHFRTMSAAELASLAQMPASIANAPPLVRAQLEFPYVDGTSLATALYQSGGLALLNAALAHPPVSTEQVLHPEKALPGFGWV